MSAPCHEDRLHCCECGRATGGDTGDVAEMVPPTYAELKTNLRPRGEV